MKALRNVSVVCLTLCFLFSCGNKAKNDAAKNDTNPEANEQQPNIVFILSDDQSWTDYSFMGDESLQAYYFSF